MCALLFTASVSKCQGREEFLGYKLWQASVPRDRKYTWGGLLVNRKTGATTPMILIMTECGKLPRQTLRQSPVTWSCCSKLVSIGNKKTINYSNTVPNIIYICIYYPCTLKRAKNEEKGTKLSFGGLPRTQTVRVWAEPRDTQEMATPPMLLDRVLKRMNIRFRLKDHSKRSPASREALLISPFMCRIMICVDAFQISYTYFI